ncbi:MAG: BNR repeat-containing protein [Draconibacterium sp.]|nr:BNR repeat-containing protein [Draconibacterium sp.]
MKSLFFLIPLLILALFGCTQKQPTQPIIIDETNKTESIEQTIKIDSVWAGQPVGFCLLTHGTRQYIAYYNANRNMVVGQRNLDEENFQLYVLPPTTRKEAGGTSTVLGWDSHNSVTIGIDKEGFIHLSGNMHVHPITYFKSTMPNNISTLEQIFEMVGAEEKRCTYPHFMVTKEGELLFHYRDGGSGNGNEIYNIYSCGTKTWSRMLDVPLTDGQGLMNAYQSQPTVLEDGWYHVYWVWRDTPDCSTNHDLSYMKSPDLKNWFNAFGRPVELPATIEDTSIIVDPIPVKGGIINLAAKLCLDKNNKPVFAYHKYDSVGNLQFYIAKTVDGKWVSKQITDWDYRWEFSGNGSINSEVRITDFKKRTDGFYELTYWHIKYGNGTILLNNNFENVGKVLKPEPFSSQLKIEGNFPGLLIQTAADLGKSDETGVRYLLKWETINRNRDRPREKPWPKPSQLYLYKLQQNE